MFCEALKASKGLPVTDHLAALWGQKIAEAGGWKVTEITGELPLIFLSDGSVLVDYRIYGTSEGAGVETGNLFDRDTVDSRSNVYLNSDGSFATVGFANQWTVSDYIPVSTGTYTAFGLSNGGSGTYCCIYNSNKEIIRSQYITARSPVYFTIVSGESFVRLSVRLIDNEIGNAMFIAGSTPPDHYIPHGYKLPLTVTADGATTDYPVYIGDSQLMEDEYVDYVEQKIYKLVDGALTPTDPPVPLPEIALPKGEATIDIEGDVKPQAAITGKIKEI